MQVHLARVDGERVVVKVQRPYLKEIFDVDLKNIRVLAQILQAVDPKSDGAARDWVAIYDECSRILYQVRCYLWTHPGVYTLCSVPQGNISKPKDNVQTLITTDKEHRAACTAYSNAGHSIANNVVDFHDPAF